MTVNTRGQFYDPRGQSWQGGPIGGGYGMQAPVGGGVGTPGGGGGIDWMQMLMGGGMLLGAGADIYGAHQQNQVNNQNFAAQLAQQQMINGLVGQYMTPANQQNPYASAMMNFLGMNQYMPGQGQSQGGMVPTQGGVIRGQRGRGLLPGGPGYGSDGVLLSQMSPNLGGPAGGGPQPTGMGDAQIGPPDMWNGGMGDAQQMMPNGGLGDTSQMSANDMLGPPQMQQNIPTPGDLTAGSGIRRRLDAGGQRVGGVGGGQQGGGQQMSGGAYQYQDPGAAQYRASLMGGLGQLNPAQISGYEHAGGLGQLQAPTLQTPGDVNAQQISGIPQVNAQQIQMPGQINLPQVGAPDKVSVNTQGFNSGQDGLMQMMNRNISAPRDASIDPMLQAGTGQFDNSALFSALGKQDNQLLDEQVNQLHGSAGSFGQRLGSQMMKNEAQLRGQFANNVAARNAGIQQQSFEAAAGRNLQGAGIQTGREQYFGQNPFQNAGLQMQAAQGLQQGGLQQAGLGLQADQFNSQQGQQAQQFNAQNAINASLASQGIAAQIGQANASNQLQAGGMNQQSAMGMAQNNQQAALQAALANQQMQGQYGLAQGQMGMNAGQFNLQQQMQAQLANQQAGLQVGSQNAGFQQQAGQFNLGNQLAMMQGNQNAMNQAGQFNANMQQQNNQFGPESRMS